MEGKPKKLLPLSEGGGGGGIALVESGVMVCARIDGILEPLTPAGKLAARLAKRALVMLEYSSSAPLCPSLPSPPPPPPPPLLPLLAFPFSPSDSSLSVPPSQSGDCRMFTLRRERAHHHHTFPNTRKSSARAPADWLPAE